MPQLKHQITAVRADAVKEEARGLGFDACGIASARDEIDPQRHFRRWLKSGFQADMDWITRTAETREDVHLKLPDVRSVVVVARNYFSRRPPQPPGTGKTAAYAWGRDYHNVLRKPILELAQSIRALEAGASTYASIDTGPVLERAWAQRAGVGAVGKNTMSLRRDLGSWFFLATILTSVELEPDAPAEDLCGTCTLCIDACPTEAIVAPRVLDSGRCISYHTIENRGEIPRTFHQAQGDWVFGCDICQEVCPWNRFARTTADSDFLPREGHANPDLDTLLIMDETAFNSEFEGTPIRRARHAGMQRNAAIAKSNGA